MKRFILFLVALLLSPISPTFSAEDMPILIRGFSYEHPVPDLHVAVDGKAIPFSLLPYEPSKPVELPAGTRSVKFIMLKSRLGQLPEAYKPKLSAAEEPITTNEDAIDMEGDDLWATVASVTLTGEGNDFMLGFGAMERPTESRLFNITSISNDLQGFPIGAIRLINCSPHQVLYDLGEKPEVLQPNETVVRTPELDAKHRSYMLLGSRRDATDKWALFHQGVVSVIPGQRSTFLFAYTSTYLDLIGSDGPRRQDGTFAPTMIVIPWVDRPQRK